MATPGPERERRVNDAREGNGCGTVRRSGATTRASRSRMDEAAASGLSRLEARMMDLLIGALAGAVVAGAVGLGLHLRHVRRLTGLAADVERARDELRTQQRTSREDREVQDLILASMEEGVLLFDRRER